MMAGQNWIYENRHLLIAIITFFFIQGCGSSQVDRNAVKEEMASREVKKITPSQLQEKGMELGQKFVDELNTKWKSDLYEQVDSGNLISALEFCTAKLDDVEAVRVSGNPRNSKNIPDSLENMILDAYVYSAENNQSISPSLHDVDPKYVLFNAPIVVDNSKCLNCHGSIGTEISEDLYDEILFRYPSDSAINFKQNMLVGMWSLKIPKKLIIQEL